MRVSPTLRDNATIITDPLHSEPGETIPVIASYDDKGRVAPLYFRINGESHKVLRYVVLNKALGKIITYECTIEDNGYMKPLIVRYYPEISTWVIPDNQRASVFLKDFS